MLVYESISAQRMGRGRGEALPIQFTDRTDCVCLSSDTYVDPVVIYDVLFSFMSSSVSFF